MEYINLDQVEREPIQGHTSKGDQPKWQQSGKWYKADHMGYEALSEVLVSRLLERSNVGDFVRYDPIRISYHGRIYNGCVSHNFRGKNEMLVPWERLHRAYYGRGLSATIWEMHSVEERIQYTVSFVERVTGLKDVGEYLTLMLELDALFLNEDRHTNNLAVLRNEDDHTFRLCPIFDNGLSLLSDLYDYPVDRDVYVCIDHVEAKPFSSSFDEQVEAAQNLYGSRLRLSFTSGDMTEVLRELSELYDPKVIDRVERVLREQMRKYPVFFTR